METTGKKSKFSSSGKPPLASGGMRKEKQMSTLLTIGIIITVISAVLCPIIAYSKGRSAFGWVFGGLLLGGVGLIIVACLRDK